MHDLLGKVIDTKVIDQNDNYYVVQTNGYSFLFDKSEADHQLGIGAHIRGFAYQNNNGKFQVTTNIPNVLRGSYAWGTVVGNAHNVGIFINIGIKNKDFVLSIDELPNEKRLWPQKNDQLLVSLCIDKTNRLWCHLANEDVFCSISRKASSDMHNQNISATVYKTKLYGSLVLTNQYYLGFIHASERNKEPRLGEQVNGRVIGVRDDGTLNLSLRKRGYESINDDAIQIMMALDHADEYTLNFSDKSDPSLIKAYFGISKGQFKRAIGHLLKLKYIVQENGHIRLTGQGQQAANERKIQ